MIDSIIDTAVMVSNGRRAMKWYKEKLGMQVEREKEGHWITARPRGSKSALHLCEGKLERGNTGIGLGTKDLDATFKRLKARGVKFTVEPRDDGWGQYAMFKDLDGNVFWLLPR